jgi:8-oxo-dGTP diphosphatase
MTIFLIRHGKAGSRHEWNAPDEQRPLVAKGLEQAKAIAVSLQDRPIVRVLSSPFLRCVQTVEPLADQFGLSVTPADVLAEGAAFELVLDLIETLPDDSALCSHGDVIPEVIRALERRGMVIDGFRDSRKGSVWIIERANGVIDRASALPPPGRDD